MHPLAQLRTVVTQTHMAEFHTVTVGVHTYTMSCKHTACSCHLLLSNYIQILGLVM